MKKIIITATSIFGLSTLMAQSINPTSFFIAEQKYYYLVSNQLEHKIDASFYSTPHGGERLDVGTISANGNMYKIADKQFAFILLDNKMVHHFNEPEFIVDKPVIKDNNLSCNILLTDPVNYYVEVCLQDKNLNKLTTIATWQTPSKVMQAYNLLLNNLETESIVFLVVKSKLTGQRYTSSRLSYINNNASIWPNPAKNVITLHGAINDAYNIKGINGVVLLSGIIENSNKELSLDNLASGIYLVTIGNVKIKMLKQ